MTQQNNDHPLVLTYRYGAPVYSANPSIPEQSSIAKMRKAQIGDERRGFVVDGVGEIIGTGYAAYYEFEEVDSERFVKIFLAGMKNAAGLSKTGLIVLEILYRLVQGAANRDKVELSYYHAVEVNQNIEQRTFQRGIKELIGKEFIYRSPIDHVYFVNIRYMFNGDRLAFVKGYRRKREITINPGQTDLFPE